MRRFPLAASLAVSILAGGPATGQTPPPDDQSAAPLQTPGAYGRSNVEHAAVAPLHDLNLTRQKIPPVLLAAIPDPYARTPRSCRAIFARVSDLTDALGPDFDEPGAPVDPTLKGRSGPMALALMHGAAENVLPFHGFVSTLSGAEKHDALVLEAINAGSVRRAYLKGIGESIGCHPPNAPHHPRRRRAPGEETIAAGRSTAPPERSTRRPRCEGHPRRPRQSRSGFAPSGPGRRRCCARTGAPGPGSRPT